MFKKNKTLAFLWQFIKRYKYVILVNFVFCILVNDIMEAIARNKIFQYFVDRLSTNSLTPQNGVFILLIYAFCSTSLYALFIPRRKFDFLVHSKMKEEMRNFIFQYVLKQSNMYFYKNLVGTLNTKINDIVSNIANLVRRSYVLCSNGITVIISTFFYFRANTMLGMFLVIWMIIYAYIIKTFYSKIKKQSKLNSEIEAESSGIITDCFTNILSIKNFSKEKKEKAIVKKQSILLLKGESALAWHKVIFDAFNFLFSFTLMAVIYIVSYKLYLSKAITLGELLFNIQTIWTLYWWFADAIQSGLEDAEIYGKMNNAIETLMTEHEIINNPNAQKIRIENGTIEIKDITYQYKNNSQPIFSHLNLTIPSNQKIGLVGYSGAGKSTLISLLLRFYDVNQGAILIDGYNIKTDINQESLRNNISYIPQDPILFHRSIRDNIAYGKTGATFEEIIEASKKAYCYDFIMQLENGFDTLVGDRGSKLSGGQRQRIAIARAILKNSKILILDEATSALDSITEKYIQQAINNLMQDKTVIAVAHRLSTLDNMDRIIVLENGKIIEDGAKETLLNNPDSVFKKMWNMQKGGFVE